MSTMPATRAPKTPMLYSGILGAFLAVTMFVGIYTCQIVADDAWIVFPKTCTENGQAVAMLFIPITSMTFMYTVCAAAFIPKHSQLAWFEGKSKSAPHASHAEFKSNVNRCTERTYDAFYF